MKYVYILTSNEKDYYCEECIISMTTLLKYNMDAEIILLVDNLTYETLNGFRAEVVRLASKVIIENFPEKYTQKMRSRLLKTSMRKYLEGTFIYLDLDTIITDSLEELDNINADIAMVLDKHVYISEHYMYKYLNSNAKKMNYSIGYKDKHFNSGVIYVSDSIISRKFFDLWHKLYLETLKKGIDIDQVSLNEANTRFKGVICELNGIWNVQINCGLKYISEAKIIHYLGYQPFNVQNKYFNTLPFKLCDAKYFDDMKKQECITEEIAEIINKPRIAFKTVMIIPNDCIAYKLIFSNHMRILKFIYVKLQKKYNFMEKVFEKLFQMIFGRV